MHSEFVVIFRRLNLRVGDGTFSDPFRYIWDIVNFIFQFLQCRIIIQRGFTEYNLEVFERYGEYEIAPRYLEPERSCDKKKGLSPTERGKNKDDRMKMDSEFGKALAIREAWIKYNITVLKLQLTLEPTENPLLSLTIFSNLAK